MRRVLGWIGTFGVVGSLAAAGGCATSAVFEQELTKTNTQTVLAFEDTVYNKHEVSEAFAHYVAPSFMEHDPRLDGRDREAAAAAKADAPARGTVDGVRREETARHGTAGANRSRPADAQRSRAVRNAYQALLTRLGPASKRAFVRTIAQKDLVATQSRWSVGGTSIIDVVDIYRLNEGRIVEHWDVVEGAAGNARGAVPGRRLPP